MSAVLFAAGLTIFFGVHGYSAVRRRGEGDIQARMGRGAYMGLYSLVSAIGLGLLIYGYAYLKPWYPPGFPNVAPPEWARHVTLTLMLPALVLVVAAYLPTGWIKRSVGHPMVTGVAVWSAAHLAYNWDAASLLLFGAFLLFALFDRAMASRRGDRGAAGEKPSATSDAMAVVIGGGLYAAIAFWLHPILFGVYAVS